MEVVINLKKLRSYAMLVFLLAGCAGEAKVQPTNIQAQPLKPQTAQTTSLAPAVSPDPYLDKRLDMVEETIVDRGVADKDVLRAMQTVPRHRFVLEEYLEQAYADHRLPIGYGQTISQPYIVAWMTELLDLQAGDRVLEMHMHNHSETGLIRKVIIPAYLHKTRIRKADSIRYGLVNSAAEKKPGLFQ